MNRSHPMARLSAALLAALAATILVVGMVPALTTSAVELPDDTTILAGVILLLTGITVVGDRLSVDHR